MSIEGGRTAIIVAGITVVGGLGTVLIANWDSVFPPETVVTRILLG